MSNDVDNVKVASGDKELEDQSSDQDKSFIPDRDRVREEKRKRLEAALRNNLRRRKGQSRARQK